MFKDTYNEETKNKFLELYCESENPDYAMIMEKLDLSESDINKLRLILKLRYKQNYTNLPGEEWKSLGLIDFPFYFVSNKGRIRRLNRLRVPVLNKGGYLKTNLYHRGRVKTYSIHRLVLIGFTGIVGHDLQVNHKDLNKTNNNLENLEWCTSKENISHFLDTKDNRSKLSDRMSGSSNISSVLEEKDVIEIRNSDKTNKELADTYNVQPEAIRRIRVYQTWKHV